MSLSDPIGDMLSRIKNGQMRLLNNINIPASNFKEKVLHVLKKEGYISNFKTLKNENKKNSFSVDLKYNQGLPVINEINRISKPGKRIYASAKSIPKIQNGLGISIVSTPKGVMSDLDARKENVGGEIICRVF